MSKGAANKDNLMPIGRFAHACRLSIKALRYYDDREVLKPAFVDPDTGYRYYRSEQAREAVMLAMLRSLDVPLDIAKQMLSVEGDELKSHLLKEHARIETELKKKRQTLRSLERLARSGSLIAYDVAIRTEPDYRLVSLSSTTSVDSMIHDGAALMYRLFDELSTLGIAPCDPFMCINETPDAKGAFVVHACTGVNTQTPIAAPVEFKDVRGGPAAWLTHVGAYEELGVAYHAGLAWVQQHGHEQRGALREIYRNDPANTPTEQLITEVILPING